MCYIRVSFTGVVPWFEQGFRFGAVNKVCTSRMIIMPYCFVSVHHCSRPVNDSNKKSNDPPVHYIGGAKVHM